MKKLLLLPIIILFASCSRDIVLDAGDRPQVVVECVLTDEPVQTLRLSFARTPLQSEAQPLTEASAILKDLTDGSVAGQFSRNEDGLWTLNYAAIPGHHYRLEVGVEGYGPISAEETMPELNISYRWMTTDLLQVDKDLQVYSDPGVYYLIESLPNHLWICGQNYNEHSGQFELAEQICTDFPGVDNFNLTGAVYDGDVKWFKIPVPGDITTMYPYDSPIAGFAGSWRAVYSHLLGQSMHRRFLRIQRDKAVDRFYFSIAGDFTDNYDFGYMGRFGYYIWSDDIKDFIYKVNSTYEEPQETNGYLMFMSVTDNYDNYLNDAIYHQQLQHDNSIENIFMHENIYSNISGGNGIFGAMAVQKVPWVRKHSYKDIEQYGWTVTQDGQVVKRN